jgi:CubicO group peptidase (beta-lactamase class C family)
MYDQFSITGDVPQPSPASVLEAYGTLAYSPNQLYEYSNVGYLALGTVASNVSGLEFGEFLTRHVLKPLGLNDSFFDSDGRRLSSIARDSVGYDELDRPIPTYVTATPPSGGLHASVHDLARFGMFNLKHHQSDQSQILNDRLIDELHAPVFRGPAGAASTFGWFWRETRAGLRVLVKDGSQPGANTLMCIVPDEDLVCVALANRTDNRSIVVQLVDQMAATIVSNWTTPTGPMDLPMTEFPHRPPYAGKWAGRIHGAGAEMTASLDFDADGGPALSLGSKRAEPIGDLHLQGSAFVGNSVGTIESPAALRRHATALSVKLEPRNDQLAGRIIATAESPGVIAYVPHIVELRRSQ